MKGIIVMQCICFLSAIGDSFVHVSLLRMAFYNGNSFFKKAPEVCRWRLHCPQGSDGNIEDGGLISLTRNIYIYLILISNSYYHIYSIK
jgi:hypothetical protein